MLSTPFAVMALAILFTTSLSARGGFGGEERGNFSRPEQSFNRPAYNTQQRIDQIPGGKAAEGAALYNRGLENGAGGGTVYQEAPTYPAAPPVQTPY